MYLPMRGTTFAHMPLMLTQASSYGRRRREERASPSTEEKSMSTVPWGPRSSIEEPVPKLPILKTQRNWFSNQAECTGQAEEALLWIPPQEPMCGNKTILRAILYSRTRTVVYLDKSTGGRLWESGYGGRIGILHDNFLYLQGGRYLYALDLTALDGIR